MTQQKTKLAIPREEAEEKIKAQISKGFELRNIPISSGDSFDRACAKFSNWSDFNERLLETIFNTREPAEKYRSAGRMIDTGDRHGAPSSAELGRHYLDNVQAKIDELESIKDRLELYEEPQQRVDRQSQFSRESISNKIFIVHGHDDGPKLAVARLLEKLGLEPIILHEQPNKGRTVIEKFEDYSDVGYAVVLLTPDDVGGLRAQSGEPDLKSRARQNVVFEHGFFIGRLRRDRVCALLGKDVEQASDMNGVLYIPLDENNAWEFKLAKELKAAGYEVDLNRLLAPN